MGRGGRVFLFISFLGGGAGMGWDKIDKIDRVGFRRKRVCNVKQVHTQPGIFNFSFNFNPTSFSTPTPTPTPTTTPEDTTKTRQVSPVKGVIWI